MEKIEESFELLEELIRTAGKHLAYTKEENISY